MNENGLRNPWITLTGDVIFSNLGTINGLRSIGIEEYPDEEYQPLGPLRLEDIAGDAAYNWTFKEDNGIWRLCFGDAGHEEPNDLPVGDTRKMDDFFNSLEVTE